ncbi:unnamed protein product, partial [Brassica rapa subsp. trilocularis]
MDFNNTYISGKRARQVRKRLRKKQQTRVTKACFLWNTSSKPFENNHNPCTASLFVFLLSSSVVSFSLPSCLHLCLLQLFFSICCCYFVFAYQEKKQSPNLFVAEMQKGYNCFHQ